MQIIPSLYNFLGACALCFNQLILVPTLSFRFQSRNLNITPITISLDLVSTRVTNHALHGASYQCCAIIDMERSVFLNPRLF
jgi:hypothetical protein